MKTLIKNISIGLLIILIFFNITGYWIYFKTEQHFIRKEIKKQILAKVPDTELVCLSFSKQQYDEIIWFESNEFYYNGNMYDVVRSKHDAKGNTTYFCVNDKKETKLFAGLNEHIQNQIANQQTSEKPTKKAYRTLLKEYVLKQTIKFNTHQILKSLNIFCINNTVLSGYIQSPFLPPETILTT